MNPLSRYQEARLASSATNFALSLLCLALFWLAFFGCIPYLLLKAEATFNLVGGRFVLPAWLGGAFLAVGGLLAVVAAASLAKAGKGTPWYGACPRRLTTTGPYRFVRNPLILGLVIQGVGVGLLFGSPWVALYGLVGGPYWHLVLRPREESDLEVRFRGEYRLYKQAVSCWLPRASPYRARG